MEPLKDGFIKIISESESVAGSLVQYGNDNLWALVLESGVPAGTPVTCKNKAFLKCRKYNKTLNINAGDYLYWDGNYPISLHNNAEFGSYVGSAQQTSLPGSKVVILDLNTPSIPSGILDGVFQGIEQALNLKQDIIDISSASQGDALIVGIEGEQKVISTGQIEAGSAVNIRILHSRIDATEFNIPAMDENGYGHYQIAEVVIPGGTISQKGWIQIEGMLDISLASGPGTVALQFGTDFAVLNKNVGLCSGYAADPSNSFTGSFVATICGANGFMSSFANDVSDNMRGGSGSLQAVDWTTDQTVIIRLQNESDKQGMYCTAKFLRVLAFKAE